MFMGLYMSIYVCVYVYIYIDIIIYERIYRSWLLSIGISIIDGEGGYQPLRPPTGKPWGTTAGQQWGIPDLSLTQDRLRWVYIYIYIYYMHICV
jgi:hypothetical protein